MPTTAQDRMNGGPLAALLILLSLFLGPAGAAGATGDLRDASSRLAAGRHTAATAILPAATRNSPDDEAPRSGGGTPLPRSAPDILSLALSARPAAAPSVPSTAARPQAPHPSYRARAPPAA